MSEPIVSSEQEPPVKSNKDNFGSLVGRHILGCLVASLTYAALLYLGLYVTEAALSEGPYNFVQDGYEQLVIMVLVALPLLVLFPTFTVVAALVRSTTHPEVWRLRKYQFWVAGTLCVVPLLAVSLFSEPWSVNTLGFTLIITMPIPIMARIYGSITGLVRYEAPAPELSQLPFPDMPKEWNES